MAETLDQAVQLMNSAKLCSDAREKADCLKGLLELVVKKEPALIPTFLPDVLALQVDPAGAVRKLLPDWVDGAVHALPTAEVLLAALQCLAGLLHDTVPAVAKRAVLSSYATFRAALALVEVHGAEPSRLAELQAAWQAAQALKGAVAGLVATSGDTHATVRLAAVKSVEQTVMLLTADAVPAVAGLLAAPRPLGASNQVITKAALVRDAEKLLSQLLGVLSASLGEDAASPLGPACIKAAAGVAQQRPQFLGRIVPPLLALAKSGNFKVDTGGASQDVAAALQAALTVVLDSRHPLAAAWGKKVAGGLASLGVAPAAQPAAAAKREPAEPSAPPPEKRARAEAAAGGVGAAAAAPHAAPSGDGGASRVAAAVPFTSAEAISRVDAALTAAVAAQDVPTLTTLLLSLQPAVMADTVLHHLHRLPPRAYLPPDDAPHEAWVEQLTAAVLAQQAQHAGGHAGGAAAAVAREPPPQASGREPSGPMAAEAQAPAAPVLPPVAPVTQTAVALTEHQAAAARRGAVLRMLGTPNLSARAARAALVARLAASSSVQEDIVNNVVGYLVQDFHGRHGLDVAVAWLYALFVEEHDGSSGGADVDAAAAAAEAEADAAAADGAGAGVAEGSYEDVLLSLLQGLRERLPASDHSLAALLLAAPALPMPAVRDFLAELCASGPEWATLGLLAARDVLLERPCSRGGALSVVLDAAVAAGDDLRTKAVRLIANRLFAEPGLAPAIQRFALEQLVATLERPHDAAAADAAAAPPPPSEADASRVCPLFCALCTRQPSLLLRRLFEAYAATSPGGRAAIRAHAGGLAKTLGAGSPALLAVLQDPPAGSVPLALDMIYALTEASASPPALVAVCLQLYDASRDARALSPALPGMQRPLVLRLLPALLDLPADAFADAVARLVAPPAGPGALPPLFAPPEVLAALHALDPGADPTAALRKAMAGITACINRPDLFPPEALAAAISQLLTRVPLPQLFMRTVIQTLAAAPRLRPFVAGVLKQLAARQVWGDATQWRGWVMCAQQAAPESFPVLLQLPAAALAQALQAAAPPLRAELAAYAASPQCQLNIQPATQAVLDAPPPA